MAANNPQGDAFLELKRVMDSYSPISEQTWRAVRKICKYREVANAYALYPACEVPESFSFVYSGLFRAFITDERGNVYNKKFFDEGTFPGSMAALLTATPSKFTVESLEPSRILVIDFREYRKLLVDVEDLKLFHIYYLEKNWLLAKDAREVELVQEDASQRYQRFLNEYPSISERIAQYHVASHLGITPTQLSRIRKKN